VRTLDELRTRYGRYSDGELQSLLAMAATSLTPEARQVLGEEAARRGLAAPLVASSSSAVRAPIGIGDVWHYPKASLWSRFVAYLIDIVIGIIMPVVAGIIGFASSRGRFSIVNGVLLIASVVWAIYYNFTKDGQNEGRSIGKRAMGLMVVNIKTNRPCSIGESSLRALMLGVLNAVPVVGSLIEPLIVLVQEDGRRVGDMVAGTQVIDATLYNPEAHRIVL
jgi:uncharacterized RDD family membrane protein YckC